MSPSQRQSAKPEPSTPSKTRKYSTQAGAGGTALAAAVIVAWGAEQAGVIMPGEVVAAVGAVIGWIGNIVNKAIGG